MIVFANVTKNRIATYFLTGTCSNCKRRIKWYRGAKCWLHIKTKKASCTFRPYTRPVASPLVKMKGRL